MPDNICIAIDSSCDLPAEFILRNNIRVLPIYLKFGDEVFTDIRDPVKTLEFYQQGMLEKNIDAETVPVSADEMSAILEQELILKYDKVVAITISSTRSKVFENIRDAVWHSQPKFKELRESNGLSRTFRFHVMDSRNLFTGPGVLVHEAIRLIREESATAEQVMMSLEKLKDRVRAFILPQDLYHLKNRASTKGDNSVSWLSYQLGSLLNVKPVIMGYQGNTSPVDKVMGFDNGLKKLFDNARSAIAEELAVNAVTMSYAGDLNDIRRQQEYEDFVGYAKEHGVYTYLSIMSTTAAINVGPGCFSLAYAD